MIPNPTLGVFYRWLGGLASGSFYIPYRAVKRWSWETYWLVGGIFSWIIAPWGGRADPDETSAWVLQHFFVNLQGVRPDEAFLRLDEIFPWMREPAAAQSRREWEGPSDVYTHRGYSRNCF